MRSKLFYFLLALTSCRQACGLDLASDGGSSQGGGGSSQGGGGSSQGSGGNSQGGGGSGSSVSSAAGGGGEGGMGGSPVPTLIACADFGEGEGGAGGGAACSGELIDTITCSGRAEASLSFDCDSGACAFPSALGSSLGGEFTVSDGVLEMLPTNSGFYSTEPALFVYSDVAESFLAVTLVQPSRRNDAAGWPLAPLNFAGLVARAANCESASTCGRWTKFELGTTEDTNPGLVFASSTDGNAATAPDPLAFAPLLNANNQPPSCPPPILVGLCGLRNGGTIAMRGLYAIPSEPTIAGVTPVTPAHSWSLPASESVEVGMVAASGFGPASGNDIEPRFGMFQLHTGLAGEGSCQALFNEVLTSLQASN